MPAPPATTNTAAVANNPAASATTASPTNNAPASLPPLPATGEAPLTAPTTNTPATLPGMAALPTPQAEGGEAIAPATRLPSIAVNSTPSTLNAEAGDITATAPVAPPVPPNVSGFAASANIPSFAPSSIQPLASAPVDAVNAMPRTEAEALPPQRKSWETRLAPSRSLPKTRFNYRRVVLPGEIYRRQYDRENRHLPKAATREDYQRLLFERVAANDINATRALLNTGINVNITDAAGNTPLSIARRYRADDTARLLIARGASS